MRGPDGSGAADSGCTLLTDMTKVKLAWKSEEQGIPGGYVRPHKHRSLGISGGFSGPIVAEGGVVVTYYVPNGGVFDAEGIKKSTEMGVAKVKSAEWLKKRWTVNADDVVICIDAKTGKTRWKHIFKQKGLNHSYEIAGPLLSPCISDGRVYTLGSAGRVYCIGLSDGKVHWETSDWPGGKRFESARKTCLEKKKMPFFHQNSYSLCSGPAVAAGVVAVNDYCGNWRKQENYGLAGLAADTGKLLWHVKDCMGGVTSPVRWVHKGKEYFIAAAPNRLKCIEAKTGKVAWEYTGHVNKLATPSISGDYLVCGGTGGKFSPKRDFGTDKKKIGITCFKLDEKGATRIWALEPKHSLYWACTAIYRGHAYAFSGKEILCIGLKTGKIVASAVNKYAHYTSILCADGRLIHRTAVFDPDPKNFRRLGVLQVGREPIGLEVYTTGAIAKGKLYLRAPSAGKSHYGRRTGAPTSIYCYDLREGKQQ